jgi:uncharacterized membrane protein YkvA (DUF1232 family)
MAAAQHRPRLAAKPRRSNWRGVADQMERRPSMTAAATRLIVRWIHIICAIPIIGYIYSPFAVIPDYAPATRFVFVPVMLLSGLWMWKGHLLRRLSSKKPA